MGLTQLEARQRFYFIDEYGLVTKSRKHISNEWVAKFSRYYIVNIFFS